MSGETEKIPPPSVTTAVKSTGEESGEESLLLRRAPQAGTVTCGQPRPGHHPWPPCWFQLEAGCVFLKSEMRYGKISSYKDTM